MSDTYSKLLRAIETNPIGAETVNAGVNIPSDYSPRPQEASSSFMRDFKDYVAAAPKVVQQLVTPEPGREYGNVLPISYDAANPQDWRWDPKGGIVGGLMTTPGRIAEAWQAGTDPNATQQQQVNAATQGALEALGLSSMGFKPHGALGTFIFRNSPMFDNAAAAQFEKLENKRKLFGLGKPYSVEELLERTGTIRTGEGLMQEISDRGATFNPNFVTTDPVTGMKITNFPKDKAYTLESAVQHPYYYMAVPEAQNASISALGTVNPASARKRGTMGLFYPDVNHIEVRNKLPVAHTNDELVDPGRMGALSYTLHEMQHLADKASGKKSGASVELPATFDRELAKAESQYRRANRTRDSVIEQNNLQGTEAEIDAQLSRIAPSVLSDAQQAAANMQRLRAMEHEAFAKYEADVGEQRARATEQRRLMTDAERRKNFPIGADKW